MRLRTCVARHVCYEALTQECVTVREESTTASYLVQKVISLACTTVTAGRVASPTIKGENVFPRHHSTTSPHQHNGSSCFPHREYLHVPVLVSPHMYLYLLSPLFPPVDAEFLLRFSILHAMNVVRYVTVREESN